MKFYDVTLLDGGRRTLLGFPTFSEGVPVRMELTDGQAACFIHKGLDVVEVVAAVEAPPEVEAEATEPPFRQVKKGSKRLAAEAAEEVSLG